MKLSYSLSDIFYDTKLSFKLIFKSNLFLILSAKTSIHTVIEFFISLKEVKKKEYISTEGTTIECSLYKIKNLTSQAIINSFDNDQKVIPLNSKSNQFFKQKFNTHLDAIELLNINEVVTI